MVGTYHLLHNPEAKQRLEDEVRTAWPDLDQVPSYAELEKLPFLVSGSVCRVEFALKKEQTAVIKETLRVAVPIPVGLPRIVPPTGAMISGVKIPGGVRVSYPFVFSSCLMP